MNNLLKTWIFIFCRTWASVSGSQQLGHWVWATSPCLVFISSDIKSAVMICLRWPGAWHSTRPSCSAAWIPKKKRSSSWSRPRFWERAEQAKCSKKKLQSPYRQGCHFTRGLWGGGGLLFKQFFVLFNFFSFALILFKQFVFSDFALGLFKQFIYSDFALVLFKQFIYFDFALVLFNFFKQFIFFWFCSGVV